AIAIGWLTWVCTRNPNINFLPRHGQAEWILFPSVMDSSARHVMTLDTIFRREFLLNERPQVAQLDIRAAKHSELKINGSSVEIGNSRNWKDSASLDVARFLQSGNNKIEVKVSNDSAPPALWLQLTAEQFSLASDGTWEASCTDSAWRPAAL